MFVLLLCACARVWPREHFLEKMAEISSIAGPDGAMPCARESPPPCLENKTNENGDTAGSSAEQPSGEAEVEALLDNRSPDQVCCSFVRLVWGVMC